MALQPGDCAPLAPEDDTWCMQVFDQGRWRRFGGAFDTRERAEGYMRELFPVGRYRVVQYVPKEGQ